MSLSPTPINDVPELTAQVARAAFPNGNRYMQMRDTLGTIYADEFCRKFLRNDREGPAGLRIRRPGSKTFRLG